MISKGSTSSHSRERGNPVLLDRRTCTLELLGKGKSPRPPFAKKQPSAATKGGGAVRGRRPWAALPVFACKPGELGMSKTIFFSGGKEIERY